MTDLGQAKVQDLGLASRRDENVSRLDITVDDACSVSRVQSVGQLNGQIQQQLGGERSPRSPLLQRLTFEQLHRDEVLALVLTHIVDGTDVGVIQGGCSSGLAPKTLQDLGITRILRQELERDRASKASILGLVHNAHASFTEPFENAKVGDGSADKIFSRRQLLDNNPGSRRSQRCAVSDRPQHLRSQCEQTSLYPSIIRRSRFDSMATWKVKRGDVIPPATQIAYTKVPNEIGPLLDIVVL